MNPSERSKPRKVLVQDLEPGDIILTGSRKTKKSNKMPTGQGLLARASWRASNFADAADSKAFALLSPIAQGSFGHAAIYVGGGNVVESEDAGVVARSLAAATRGKPFLAIRPAAPRKVRDDAAEVATRQVGKPYDLLGAVGAGALLTLPKSVTSVVVGRLLSAPDNPDAQRSFQCAALVGASYRAAGVDVGGTPNWRFVAPAHLLANPRNEIVTVSLKGREIRVPSRISQERESVSSKLSKIASAFHDELEKLGGLPATLRARAHYLARELHPGRGSEVRAMRKILKHDDLLSDLVSTSDADRHFRALVMKKSFGDGAAESLRHAKGATPGMARRLKEDAEYQIQRGKDIKGTMVRD
jgi:cell wall-associated NlpC family hydrolase